MLEHSFKMILDINMTLAKACNRLKGYREFLKHHAKYILTVVLKKTALHTQKSRLYLRFLKRPPTKAAKWITWVGLCFSKIALVAAASLKNKSRKKSIISLLIDRKTLCTKFSRKHPSFLLLNYLVIMKTTLSKECKEWLEEKRSF